MELLCTERVSPEEGCPCPRSGSGLAQGGAGGSSSSSRGTAAPDPVLLRRRVLDNLLRTEERYLLTTDYFGTVQTDVTPDMRRLLAEWMLEVCEDQNCQEEVFSLAMAYLDRFLSICAISKNQLQLLGSACLLLASKLREPRESGLPGDVLVFFTANSITLNDLKNWELLVLSKLKWDMACVTPNDFLPLLVPRLLPAPAPPHAPVAPCAPASPRPEPLMVTRHAQTFIALAARDIKFRLYSASTVAACSVAAALRGLGAPGQLRRLRQLTRVDTDHLRACLHHIEDMVQRSIDERAPHARPWSPAPHAHAQHQQQDKQQQQQQHAKAATPTDVRDVHF